MGTRKIRDLSRIVLEVFKRELTPGKLKKVVVKDELSREEMEIFESFFLSSVSDVAIQWLIKFFPQLSQMEECPCGCEGLRMKGKKQG